MPVLVAAAIGNDHEVAAPLTLPPVFARRDDIAVMSAMIPIVSLADSSIEAVAISTVGVRAIFAVNVASDHVSRQAAQNKSSDDRAAAAVTDRATNDPAC